MGLLSWLFRRFSTDIGAATPENPRFSLNDPAAWEAFAHPGRSPGGVKVNTRTALGYSPWWRGINLISNDVAKLPLFVYRREGDKGKTRDADHPAFRLLRRQPNERMTAFQFKKLMIVWAMSEGNAYAHIERFGDGRPAELLPLDPASTWPVVNKTTGQLLYVTMVGGAQKKLLPENVLHVHGMGFDGLQGLAVWEVAQESLGLGLAPKRYMLVTFKHNARPSVVLQVPVKMTQKNADAMVRGWDKMFGGIDNAARTAVLDAGTEAKVLSFSPRDAQMKDVMSFQVIDVANFLNLPAYKLGGGTPPGISLEQQNQSYLDEGLDPWLVSFEDQCWEKLLTEEEKDADSHLVEFSRKDLIRANLNDRTNYYRTALGGRPWLVPDEVRDEEGLHQLGGEAAEYLNPLNMGQGGADNEEKPPGRDNRAPKPDDAGGDDEEEVADEDARRQEPGVRSQESERLRYAAQVAIRDVAGRLIRRVNVHAIRAAGDGGAAFVRWVDSLAAEHRQLFLEACRPAMATIQGRSSYALADYLLTAIEQQWKTLAGETPEKDLLTYARLKADHMEHSLPGQAIDTFLPELTHEPRARS